MNDNKKYTFMITIIMLALFGLGCQEKLKNKTKTEPATKSAVKNNNESNKNKFVSTPQQTTSAVDSAIELANKCEAYSKEIYELKTQNNTLSNANEKLEKMVQTLEPELANTKKELSEANDLLVEMRLELNNWKDNVLGYRDEMRKANKAQLQALLKVLEILGGEVNLEETNYTDHD